MTGKAGARCVVADVADIIHRQEKLADRGQVKRRASAHGSNYLHARALGHGPLDINDLVALADR